MIDKRQAIAIRRSLNSDARLLRQVVGMLQLAEAQLSCSRCRSDYHGDEKEPPPKASSTGRAFVMRWRTALEDEQLRQNISHNILRHASEIASQATALAAFLLGEQERPFRRRKEREREESRVTSEPQKFHDRDCWALAESSVRLLETLYALSYSHGSFDNRVMDVALREANSVRVALSMLLERAAAATVNAVDNSSSSHEGQVAMLRFASRISVLAVHPVNDHVSLAALFRAIAEVAGPALLSPEQAIEGTEQVQRDPHTSRVVEALFGHFLFAFATAIGEESYAHGLLFYGQTYPLRPAFGHRERQIDRARPQYSQPADADSLLRTAAFEAVNAVVLSAFVLSIASTADSPVDKIAGHRVVKTALNPVAWARAALDVLSDEELGRATDKGELKSHTLDSDLVDAAASLAGSCIALMHRALSDLQTEEERDAVFMKLTLDDFLQNYWPHPSTQEKKGKGEASRRGTERQEELQSVESIIDSLVLVWILAILRRSFLSLSSGPLEDGYGVISQLLADSIRLRRRVEVPAEETLREAVADFGFASEVMMPIATVRGGGGEEDPLLFPLESVDRLVTRNAKALQRCLTTALGALAAVLDDERTHKLSSWLGVGQLLWSLLTFEGELELQSAQRCDPKEGKAIDREENETRGKGRIDESVLLSKDGREGKGSDEEGRDHHTTRADQQADEGSSLDQYLQKCRRHTWRGIANFIVSKEGREATERAFEELYVSNISKWMRRQQKGLFVNGKEEKTSLSLLSQSAQKTVAENRDKKIVMEAYRAAVNVEAFRGSLDGERIPAKAILRDGVFLLEGSASKETGVDVIFLHGMQGGAQKTWRLIPWSTLAGHPVLGRFVAENPKKWIQYRADDRKVDDAEGEVEERRKRERKGGGFRRNIMRRWGKTGATEEKEREEEEVEGELWPELWLKRDFPDIRIFSIRYKANMSNWQRKRGALSLEDRALDLLFRLSEAEIGKGKTVFICHSLGGLVVKEALCLAGEAPKQDVEHVLEQLIEESVEGEVTKPPREDIESSAQGKKTVDKDKTMQRSLKDVEEKSTEAVISTALSRSGPLRERLSPSETMSYARELFDSTRAVVFYSTPHFGSTIAKTAVAVRAISRPSPVIEDLMHYSPKLIRLNERFQKLVSSRLVDEDNEFEVEKEGWRERRREKESSPTSPSSFSSSIASFSKGSDQESSAPLLVQSFGESLPTSFSKLGGKFGSIFMVPPLSANPGFGNFAVLEDTDHITVCKPYCTYHPGYVLLKRILTRVCRESGAQTEDDGRNR